MRTELVKKSHYGENHSLRAKNEFLNFTLQKRYSSMFGIVKGTLLNPYNKFSNTALKNNSECKFITSGWKIFIRSETLKIELGAEGLRQQTATSKLSGITSELI